MKHTTLFALAVALILAGCAGKPQQLYVNEMAPAAGPGAPMPGTYHNPRALISATRSKPGPVLYFEETEPGWIGMWPPADRARRLLPDGKGGLVLTP